jgi:hypothetical protein
MQLQTANQSLITNQFSLLTDPAVVAAVVLDVSAQGCDLDLDFLEDAPAAVAVWAGAAATLVLSE